MSAAASTNQTATERRTSGVQFDKSLETVMRAAAGTSSLEIAKAYADAEVVAKYKARFARLRTMREHMDPIWADVRDLLDPGASRWLEDAEDEDDSTVDDSLILDTLPRKMLQTAADGLHGGLSNPSVQWFSLFKNAYKEEENLGQDSMVWLKNAEEAVRDVLANTNFYLALHAIHREVLAFGCALSMVHSDPDKLVRFYNYTIGSYWVGVNSRRIVDTAYIRSRVSARDLVETYGIDRMPSVVKDAIANKGEDDNFNVIQCIQPWNFFGDVGVHGQFEFEDVRFVEGSDDEDPVLYRGGYATKPFIFARWSESWDYIYPRSCPGIDALPDVRQLYKLVEYYNLAMAWAANPAIMYDANIEHELASVKPGDLIPIRASSTKVPVQPVIPPVFDFNNIRAYRQELMDRISNIFYNREIMMITGRAESNHVMTAMEVGLLNQEKNAVLGPITTRTSYDILIPSITRAYEIITKEWGILDDMPEELKGADIQPYFTSDLAVTQRQAWMHRANDVLLWMQQAAGIGGADVIRPVNFEKWLREFEKTDMIPAHILREESEVEQMKQAEQQAAQAQGQMEGLSQMAKAGKDMGATPTTGENLAAATLGGDNTAATEALVGQSFGASPGGF